MAAAKAEKTQDFAPKIETETLRGDIRDAVLTEFKQMQKPWQTMTEDEQQRVINRAESIANTLVRGAIDLIAARGLPSIPIEVGKMTMDGAEVEGKFKCFADDEMLLRARHLQNSRAMFVLASPDAFNGEEKKPEPDVVGDLAMPKGPTDAEAIAHFGRKNGSGEAHA